MAFVTCNQFKTSQEEQDKRMISAEDELLDKSSGVGGGKVTIKKIKEAIAGDVEVAVKLGSGITGNGTKDNPLAIDKNSLASQLGSSDAGKNLLKALKDNNLLGEGLDLNDEGQLIVKLHAVVDASGTVHQFYAVKK